MEKRCLYIVLTRTNTVISKLIHVIKNDEYTHAAIAFDRELDHMLCLASIISHTSEVNFSPTPNQ